MSSNSVCNPITDGGGLHVLIRYELFRTVRPGLLTMENPEIPVGKSNGTHHSFRNTSEIMGFWSK